MVRKKQEVYGQSLPSMSITKFMDMGTQARAPSKGCGHRGVTSPIHKV